MSDVEDQFFDNPDDEIENQLFDESDEPEDEPDSGGGDIRIALRKEREARKAQEEENKQLKRDFERTNALLQQIGQQRQAPAPVQRDPATDRTRLWESLQDRPDEVFAARDQHLMQQFQQAQAPLVIEVQKSRLKDDPEFGAYYRSSPTFKEAADKYIANVVSAYGNIDPDSLKETLSYMKRISDESRGGQPFSNQKAKDRLGGGIADRGGSRRVEDEDALDKASKMDPHAFAAWSRTKEGKAALGRALKT